MALPVEVIDEPRVGTATWMVPPRVTQIFPYSDGAVWLGRNGDDARSMVGRKDDSHVLLCAMNRSGKGRALITNNLLLWQGSLVCNDPKGENASICAARRGQGSEHVTKPLGQKVCVLDSHGTANVQDRYRAYYNVLDELDPNDPNTEAKAEDIVASFITESVRKDPTWDEMAVPYMKALLLHIATAPRSSLENDGRVPASERDLITFRRFILRGDFFGEAYLQSVKSTEELKAHPIDAQFLLLKMMEKNTAFGGVIADNARSLLNSLKVQPKLWNSVRIAADTATKWIDDQQLRKVLRAGTYPNTFRASELELDPKGISIFVCLKLKDQEKFAAWPRMIMNMALAAAQDQYFRSPASGHNTLMMFDEFAALQKMKSVENAAPAIAGAGIKLFLVLQNLSQMKSVYGENWETFASCAGTHIYYGFNDNFTAEYVQKRLGDVEVIRTMRSGSKALGTSQTTTDTRGGGTSQGTNQQFTRNQGTTSGRGGSSGESSGYGDSSNTTHGWGPSLFHLSLISSRQDSSGRSRNHGTNSQTSWQKARTHGTAQAKGSSETISENWSRAVANQQSETNTEGWQQTLHKKPLAAIHELMQLFGTIDDPQEPNYPGIGLISTAEKEPALIQKCFYDEDAFFEGMFDPHPKHGIKIEEAPVETPAVEKPRALRHELRVSLNVSDDAFRSSSNARYEMVPEPTVADPNAHRRDYKDSLIILPSDGLGEGSPFKKGQKIADYYYGILSIGKLEERHLMHSLIAPADGYIASINEFGWEATVDGQDIIIKDEAELKEIQKAQRAVDGNRISDVRRAKTQIELVLDASPTDREIADFKDATANYVELFYEEYYAKRAKDDAEDDVKEFKAGTPFSLIGMAAVIYVLFIMDGGWAVIFFAVFGFIGLAALRVPEDFLIGIPILFNPWRTVVWIANGFRPKGHERAQTTRRQHEEALKKLEAAHRALKLAL